ncbi:MAG: UDP-3-O-(3-hydroxymyristoyl)glucosamine N-acyltransferase [Betaproteobacteria bacterium]|nr:UDP-3-O-(3-hydroxymyristoyl)glucosamine N-acyltransferase [Betaproteobacteria bacterium]
MAEREVLTKLNSVAILGFHDGSAGQVEAWFEEATGYHIACFVHEAAEPLNIDVAAENAKRATRRMEYPTLTTFKGRPFIVSDNWLEQLIKLGINKVLPLTPNNEVRLKQINKCRQHGMELVSAIHPSVTILDGATIEPGVWINAGSLIGYKAEIESGVLINTGAQIDHHNVLKQCCQVDPGVVTAGNVTLRECCHIHTGATIINRIEIGRGAVVGAGAVVIRNIPANCTAVGVPARVIRERG